MESLVFSLTPDSAFTRRRLAYMGVLFAAYVIVGQIVHTFVANSTPAFIWPSAGIALAGTVLGGYAFWPAIALASLVNSYLNGTGVLLALVLAFGNTVQALVGAWLLKKLDFNASFNSLRDAIVFIFSAGVAAAVIPTVRAIAAFFGGPAVAGTANTSWGQWWCGELLAFMVVTAFLVRWLPRPHFVRRQAELLEVGASFVLLALIDVILFWTPYTQVRTVPLLYFILVPFLWMALRNGPRFMTLAIFLNATIAIAGLIATFRGTPEEFGVRLFAEEIFLIIISVIFLIVVSVSEERKNAAKALGEHLDDLTKAFDKISRDDEAKSRFIATLAHELRNPLAPLLSSLELMALEEGASERGKQVGEMTQHVRAMRHLLDDLLDISRITRNKFTLQKERVDLQSIVNRSVRTTEGIYAERNHTIGIELPSEALLLEADPVRLEQIVVNLLNNAAKYTEPGGTISISARRDDSEIVLEVRDTGIGISSVMLDRIFEPFLQLSEDGRTVSGLGIGLSLTKGLVELHEGTIEAESEGAGEGSRFIVRLPRADAATPVAEAQAPAMPAKPFRILVVDDNRPAAVAIKKLLQKKGHRVEVAFDGESALVAALQYEPDVVLLDIGLPGMDGYETAKRLRKEGHQAALVALTGYGQDGDKRRADGAGFDYHLVKPVGLAEIEAVLAKL